MIKVEDLFAKDEILEQRGTANASLQRVMIVRYRHAVIRGHCLAAGSCYLMQLAARASDHFRCRAF